MKQMTIFDVIPDEFDGGKLGTFRAKTTDNYEDFCGKFETLKTTDDCFTPPEVYAVVLNYVRSNFPQITNLRVARPFYPNGDFENYDYENAVVIDNPPFSIGAKIVRFYLENKIPFFLFAPYLTCFSFLRQKGCSVVLCDANIVYENGAVVNTSFVTNLLQDVVVRVATNLSEAINKAQNKDRAPRIKQVFDRHLFNSTRLAKGGGNFDIYENECIFNGNWAFGGGLLVSDAALQKIEAANNTNKIMYRELTAEQKLALQTLNL